MNELSCTIRKALKENGIKGCTVSVRGGYTSMLTVNVKMDKSCFVDLADFVKCFHENIMLAIRYDAIFDGEKNIPFMEFNGFSTKEKNEIIERCAKYYYEKFMNECYNFSCNDKMVKCVLKEEAYNKLYKIFEVVESYHYDKSDIMRDYFDTNFYYDITMIPKC